jgi:predicted RNA-binding Zn-ribbon protein involved in translation (DUF1610 family)
MIEKKCINCDSKFNAKSNKAKFCSSLCGQKYRYKNSNAHTYICGNCGTEFTSNIKNLTYCSKSCATQKNSVTIDELDMFIASNIQLPVNIVAKNLNIGTSRIYDLIKAAGHVSYKAYVGYVKGVYDEGVRSDTSVSANIAIKLLEDILQEEAIAEYSFENCTNPSTGKVLRFDAYFKASNIAFEYQGIQHHKHIPFFHKGNNTLEYQQYKDAVKREYCTENNILLIILNYDEPLTKEILVEKLSLIPSQSAAKLRQ